MSEKKGNSQAKYAASIAAAFKSFPLFAKNTVFKSLALKVYG